MNYPTQKYLGIVVFFLTLTSCVSNKTIVRNYGLFSQGNCDCLTSHPIIVIGTTSNYFSKEKAYCTSDNFVERRDSIFSLSNQKQRLEEDLVSEDSLNQAIIRIDSRIDELKKDWTHLRIKTKWKGSTDSTEVLILKQKISYYNEFKFIRKRIGIEKYKNGALQKSKLKNGFEGK